MGRAVSLADVQPTINEMVRRIVRRFDPERIILFGSLARGDATTDSDADLLVVMRFDRPRRAVMHDLRMELVGVGMPKDIVPVTPDEADGERDVPGSLVRAAHLEGTVLYDRAG
jgi:predicted nucleotidyltransferase